MWAGAKQALYDVEHYRAALETCGQTEGVRLALEAWSWIRKQGSTFTKRALLNARRKLKTAADADAALATLREHDYIWPVPQEDRGGRGPDPFRVCAVNPYALKDEFDPFGSNEDANRAIEGSLACLVRHFRELESENAEPEPDSRPYVRETL